MSGKPLRILQILRAPTGGLFRHACDLAQALAERGHQLGLVISEGDDDAQTPVKLEALAPSLALGVHRFPMTRLLGLSDLTTPLAIRRLAKKLGANVLHGHGAKGGVNARLARMGNNKRVALYTTHGGVLNYKPGSMASHVFRRLEHVLLSQTDAIVFESAFVQAAYRTQVAHPKCPAPVIHNGLAAGDFEEIAVGDDAHDFVFVGEFRPVKGIDTLLDALAGVKAPDGRPATIIIAGDGPEAPAIRAQIERLNLGGRVELAGVQPARKMFALGRCALVPSLAESLPYVIMEAAAAARPVIATDVGGVKEIFGPTANRLLPAGDAGALGAAMQDFMDFPDKAEAEMRERLAHIQAHFSLARMTDAIEALYFDTLARR